MRELVFALSYDPGANRVADTLREHPDARVRSLSLHVTGESLWRADHATGPAAGLEEIREAFLDGEYYADCLADGACGATQQAHVLEHTTDSLILYSYWDRNEACESIPHKALDHLGEGTLFETRRDGPEYIWRVFHPDGGDVRAFFDSVEAAVGDETGLDVRRLAEAGRPTDPRESPEELSTTQTEALYAAVEAGYYESPREISVEELADQLDVPRSTLTYRLRRAEEYLAKQAVANSEFRPSVTQSV